MKTILLLAHDDDGYEARLQAALDVTRAVGGHLTCLDVVLPPLGLMYDEYAAPAAAELMQMERDRESALRTRTESRLTREDVAWDWQEAGGLAVDAVIGAAGLSDLVVLSLDLPASDVPELRGLAAGVVQSARRPVVAVPASARGLDISGKVLVAWDSSREADDALRDAVPLLRLAAEVVLYDLDEPAGDFGLEAAATYLSRHGVHARAETGGRAAGGPIFAAILEKARAEGAAYIVMGAFSHAPTIEAIFGGVTRSMLAHSDIPLFLSH